MASLSAYIGMALSGLVCITGSTVYAQSLSGAARNYGSTRNKKPADPAEYFLVAFGLCQDAEKASASGNYVEAMKKARQAEKVLATIVRDYPTWKPDMVRFRREKLAGMLAQYKQAAANAPIPTGKQPGKTLPKADTLIPNLPERPTDNGRYIDPDSVALPNYDTTDKELYNTIARLKEECSRLAHAYSELDAQHKNVQKELVASQLDMKMYKERYEKLQAEIAKERSVSNELVASYAKKLAETEEKLRASEAAREAAENRAAELSTQLAETQAELARVTKERDALKAENEQLRAIIELNNPEKTKALLDQNLTLAEQLKQARQRVADLEAAAAGATDENDVLNQQLDSARDEVEQLREQLSAIYDENRGYRRRVSELTERLNNLEAAANAQAAQPTIDPALVEETEVLKDIIAKQRRTIEMQEEGRQMMLETYKQLKNENNEMVAQLQKLEDESKLDLTDAEKRLIEAIRNGEKTEAEPNADTEAVRRSLSIETLTKQADNAFNKSRYTAAEQLYRTLYDYQPDHVPCLVNLGTILLYRNKCEEGIEYLTRATRLAPDLPISYFLAGICYYRMDRMEEAEQMFIYTIELDPANAEAFFYLANIEGITGRIDLALSHFAAAVKLKPTLADAHYNMARLYAEQGRIPDAARAYDRAIQAGAEPDTEFENYLRNHPDNAKQPGDDLVEQIQPEAEAKKLKDEHHPDAEPAQDATEQPQQPEGGTDIPTEEPQPPVDHVEAERQAVLAEIARLATGGTKAAPTPSSAGNSTKVDKSLFGTKTVRVKKGRHTKKIRLRLKRSAPQRIRESGGDIKLLNPPKPEKQLKKNGRKKRR